MIYDKIKSLCKEQGLSINSLENAAGLSKGAISKWNKSKPTVDKLSAVAKILGISIDKLLDNDNKNNVH